MATEIKKENTDAPICAICGRPITTGCTIDHVIPQAIYKWHEQYLSRPEFMALRKRITSPRNTVRTHRRCNERKEESIVRIASLHVSRTKRSKLHQTYTAVEPYIEAFLKRKDELRERQEGCCYVCRKPLREGGVLRRIDETLDRTWDNACLICHRCNCKVKSKDVKTYRLNRLAAASRSAQGAKPEKLTPAAKPAAKPVAEVAQTVVVSPDTGGAAPVKRHRRRRRRHGKKPPVQAPATQNT